jgi:hypothetical protein
VDKRFEYEIYLFSRTERMLPKPDSQHNSPTTYAQLINLCGQNIVDAYTTIQHELLKCA